MWRAVLPLLASGCVILGEGSRTREAWWYQVSAGYQTTCGLLSSGTVDCWGENGFVAPRVEMQQVSAGYVVSCGVTATDRVQCWGPLAQPVMQLPEVDEARQVSTFGDAACVVDWDDEVTCWGGVAGVTASPAGSFHRVEVGAGFACALDTDGGVRCWGNDDAGEADPPGGGFVDVDVADDHACAIDEDDDHVTCWGAGDFSGLTDEYADVAVGWDFSCGLDFDGEVTCVDSANQPTHAPPGDRQFVAIDAGYAYVCGVGYDGVAACWGDDDHGETAVPRNPE